MGTFIDYSVMRPHITDRLSLNCYLDLGYSLEQNDPHWLLIAPDGALYGTVDRAMGETIMRFRLARNASTGADPSYR